MRTKTTNKQDIDRIRTFINKYKKVITDIEFEKLETTLYNKTAGGGGTGLYFRNSAIGSGAVGELISKKKATALAIALG